MSNRRPPIPAIDYVQRLDERRVRVFFNDGLVLETLLPKAHTHVTRADSWGTGLRFGRQPGDEMSAYAVYVSRGRVVRHGSSEQLRNRLKSA